MILSKPDLLRRLPEIIPDLGQRDFTLVNPASIDIRIGYSFIVEDAYKGWFEDDFSPEKGDEYKIEPQEFVLVSTYEYICAPNDLALELKLKSSRAREGWNHSLAFWVDPGWKGILTMEVQNVTLLHSLVLKYKMPFAQLIVHQLTTPVEDGYNGRYQNASSVEGFKEPSLADWNRIAK